MEVTVEDVMNLPSTRNCSLVAGKLGLCKTVRWFLGMLSPVVEPWVHEHEILFIYGFFFMGLLGLKNMAFYYLFSLLHFQYITDSISLSFQ